MEKADPEGKWRPRDDNGLSVAEATVQRVIGAGDQERKRGGHGLVAEGSVRAKFN
jgi:hypothetical protein